MSIEDLEVLRKKARNIYICGTVITAVVCILMLKEFKDSDAMNLPFVLGLIITMSIGNGPRKEFLRAYKNTFVLKPLYMIFTDLVFNPDMGLDSKIIRETGMMYMGTGYHSNDLISGKYKDINVLLSDVNIWQKAGKSSVLILIKILRQIFKFVKKVLVVQNYLIHLRKTIIKKLKWRIMILTKYLRFMLKMKPKDSMF